MSTKHNSETADELLVLLFSDCIGFAVKRQHDVRKLLNVPVQIHNAFIKQLSEARSVERWHGTLTPWKTRSSG